MEQFEKWWTNNKYGWHLYQDVAAYTWKAAYKRGYAKGKCRAEEIARDTYMNKP